MGINPDGSLSIPARPAWSERDLARLRELRLKDGFSEQQIAEEAELLGRPAEAYTVSAETVEKFRQMWRDVAPESNT